MSGSDAVISAEVSGDRLHVCDHSLLIPEEDERICGLVEAIAAGVPIVLPSSKVLSA